MSERSLFTRRIFKLLLSSISHPTAFFSSLFAWFSSNRQYSSVNGDSNDGNNSNGGDDINVPLLECESQHWQDLLY